MNYSVVTTTQDSNQWKKRTLAKHWGADSALSFFPQDAQSDWETYGVFLYNRALGWAAFVLF